MSVPNVLGATLREKILENANPETLWLETDSAHAYWKIGQEAMDHATVDHAAGQYKAEGGVSTNLLEGFFSQLKRSIDGTHHHVSVAHLNRYLAQFDFLYTNTRDTDSGRMRTLLSQVAGRRLTYNPLVNGA
jgi:hypothetical protein